MKIKNFDELAVNEARKRALLIAEAGLEAIDTEKVLKEAVRLRGDSLKIKGEDFSLGASGKVIFIGIGKCAVEAGMVFEELLGDHLTAGAVIDVKSGTALKKLKSFKGSHPLPSEENAKASREVVALLKGLDKNDLVIFAISGGGSTLLCLSEGGGCEEEIAVIRTLMRAGATIEEMNIVRKHLSLARGGFLAKYAYPARVVSLIFSDVPGNDIAFVASGPTVKDTTTIEDAEKILKKYDVLRTCGIENCGLVETPKENIYFSGVRNILALSNEVALAAMRSKAQGLGLQAKICTNCLTGEAADVGRKIADDLHKTKENSVLLFGGETTVTVRGKGRGGRNLELGLSALRFVRDDEIIVPVASDGKDNGPFGGAVCDTITKKAIENVGISIETFLKDNNEYPVFEKIGNYLMMGDTGSNVSDLVIALKM